MEHDTNVDDLTQRSDPVEWGNMMRLASDLELLKTEEVQASSTLWEYLVSRGYSPIFVERVAKVFWRKACEVIDKIPYQHVVCQPHGASHYQLTAHLLRSVCERQVGAGPVSTDV